MTSILVRNFADEADVYGGAWSTLLPLSNVQTIDVEEIARSLYATKSSTCLGLTFTKARDISHIALINHNFTGDPPEVDVSEPPLWRVRGIQRTGTGLVVPATMNLRAKPLAIVAAVNLSGAVSLLQDPDPENPGGTWLTAPVSTSDTQVRVSFDVGDPYLLNGERSPGVGLHEVRAVVRKKGTGADPVVHFDLWQPGAVLVTSSFHSEAVSSTDGQLVTGYFNSATMSPSPAPASTVEVAVRGVASATATVEVDCVELIPWITSGGDIVTWDIGSEGPQLPPGYWDTPDPLENLYAVNLTNDGGTRSAHSLWIDFTTPTVLDIGRLFIGERLSITDPAGNEHNFRDYSVKWVDPSPKGRTRGSRKWVDIRKKYRRLELYYEFLSRSSATAFFNQIQRSLGSSRQLLVLCEEPGAGVAEDTWMDTCVLGTLEDTDDMQAGATNWTAPGQGYHTTLRIEEEV
ncbi:MAG TPA: hypothetical protein VLT87_10960 [Thermoanaerobaculia bacterium]|nr:hypothetical protein [Thermoanaerobaculia bacterium]